MILTAHQPSYLPWLGYLAKIDQADLFLHIGGVQYSRHDFINRTQIKGPSGPQWLSAPVDASKGSRETIDTYKYVQNGWQRKHLETIRHTYGKLPFFFDYFDSLAEILEDSSDGSVSKLNLRLLHFALNSFQINTPIRHIDVSEVRGTKSELVLNLCKDFQASDYIFGGMGRDYADAVAFKSEGVVPHFQKFLDLEYTQAFGPFVSRLSFLDVLFNLGPDSRAFLLKCSILEN